MGIIYEQEKYWVEARTKSIVIAISKEQFIEIDYDQLNDFAKLVELAKEVRRDK